MIQSAKGACSSQAEFPGKSGYQKLVSLIVFP